MDFRKYFSVISLLIICVSVYYSFSSLTPSKDYLTSNVGFSTERSLGHLKQISKKPHYTGSTAHNVVREYIISEFEKRGLQVETQEQVAVNKKWRAAANTKNILTRIKGSGEGKALLLLTHYDSNPHSSLGASDAGSGVITILEGVSAYLANKQVPKNDIIICISDAEELGLLGANAFVNHHPWAKDVGLVLNFEARGSGGPSYMLLETNGGNKNLIEAFHKANTPFPVGNSFMYSLYKMLPNDTDLTVFREHGNIDGFNFAFIGDHFDYHTAQDSFERMDLESLNHQASYLMACLNYFGNSDLGNLKSDQDYVYFNFPYLGMVFYPFSWVLPMFVVCLLFFIALLVIGLIKSKLTVIGVLKGFIPFVLSLLFSGLISFFGWKLLLKLHPQYNDILHGFTYNGYYYIGVVAAFSLALCFWFYKGFIKKRSGQDLLIAPLFVWLVINGFAAFYLKGAGFFIIPVFVLLTIQTFFIFSNSNKNYVLLITAISVPVLIIFTPFIRMFPVGLGLKMLFAASIFTVLLVGFLLPVFKSFKFNKKLAQLCMLIGFMALISATLKSSYSNERKQPNSIIYVHDVIKNKAYWASYNNKTDEFTKQFLGDTPIKGSYDTSTYSSKYKTKINLFAETEILPIKKPTITIEYDTVINSERMVCLHITSLRNANKVSLMTKIPIKFKELIINNESVNTNSFSKKSFYVKYGAVMNYFRTSENEIIEIEMVVDENQQFDFDIIEAKYDLFTNPLFNIQPRAESMMPMPFVLNDASIIKMNLKF